MTKLIDIEILREEVARRAAICENVADDGRNAGSADYYKGKAESYREALRLIDSMDLRESAFDFHGETEALWESIPRRTHAIYDRIKVYGARCLMAGSSGTPKTEIFLEKFINGGVGGRGKASVRTELDEIRRTSYELYPITKKHGKTGRDLNYIKRMCYQRKRYAELLRSIIGEGKGDGCRASLADQSGASHD